VLCCRPIFLGLCLLRQVRAAFPHRSHGRLRSRALSDSELRVRLTTFELGNVEVTFRTDFVLLNMSLVLEVPGAAAGGPPPHIQVLNHITLNLIFSIDRRGE